MWDQTGCVTGGVPPFGNMFGIPLWVDRSMGRSKDINFNCGLRTKSISMSYDDWFKVEKPTWHVFTEEELLLGDLPAAVEKKKPEPKERGAGKKDKAAK